ncbi:MAG: flagellar hook-basal body complex protein [Rickettsiales bacterium]|nr:MAG: flagellar hook-basal body complex protein [Rickettsiales bacterium]
MTNTLTNLLDAAKMHGDNIGKAKSPGAKAFTYNFIESSSGNSKRTTSTVDGNISRDFRQGEMENTGRELNIAVDGAGMFVVSNMSNGAISVTRRGDFEIDDQGFVKNAANQYLRGIKLENDGSLPANSNSIDKLEAINFANPKGTPVPSSIISISMNLNSDQEALRGNGVTTSINRIGKNAGKTSNEILFPEKVGGTSLTIGDSFTFTSSTTGIDKTVTYGGLVLAKRPSNNNPIYGSTDASRSFVFNDPLNGNLQAGSKIKISIIGGQTYTFTVLAGTENAKNGVFNTINGLAAAINNISSLSAKTDNEGRLHIAPKNANNGLIFENVGGNLVETLGLTNLEKATGTVCRFNSMSTLRDAVNTSQDTYSLKATIEDKDLKITSLLASAEFTIAADSLGITKISKAEVNPNQTEKGRASVFITAPSHGLSSGEFVKVNGLNNVLLPDALYVVGEVNPNGFTICLNQADPALFPAANAAPNLVLAADASWQKVAGQTFVDRAGTVTNVPAGAGAITIELPAGTTAQTDPATENWIANDIVYISGIGSALVGGRDITVPDGYYNIVAVGDNGGARTITINPTANIAAAGAAPIQAFSVRKIATGPLGGAPGLDSRVFVTTGLVDPLTSGVKMYMNNHGYVLDDIISFKDLPDGFVVDGIPINNNTKYKVSRIGEDNGAEFLVFQVKDINGDVIPAANGDDATDAKNYVADVNNSFINNSSQLIKYFGLNQEKSSYEKTYDANNVDKNLSAAANNNANFANNLTYSVPLNVYDSLGSSFPLTLYFAKLNNNEWAVEVTAQKNADGLYDITNMLTENGLIRQGIIKFNNLGEMVGEPQGFESEIIIQRNNGSAPINLKIDWQNKLSEITQGTVSQTQSSNNVEIIQNNGQGPGTLLSMQVSKDGFIVGTFSNGETKNLYKIPLAMFANVNGLVPSSNGTFQISNDSGPLLLKGAGDGGAGSILGGVVESSNVDITKEMLDLQDLNANIQATTKALALKYSRMERILSELGK